MENVTSIYGEGGQAVVGRSVTAEMAVSRQAQEVQAAMVIAKKFPRDEVESYNRVLRSCQRKSLAEQAMYEYPRGGTKVTGPSIRLAEAIAQNWGNLDFGIIELEQKHGESQVMAYAWDLETNTRQTKIFSVPHIRSTKKGNISLSDPRDIYELVANQGARRLRACILGIIPGDVIDSAVEQCMKTMTSGNKEPLIDRVRKMAKAFEDDFSVTLSAIEKYLGCKHESFSENDFVRLKNVYKSLRDGMAKREDYFELEPAVDAAEISDPFKDSKAKKEKQQVKKQSKEEPAAVPDKEGVQPSTEPQELDPSFIPPEEKGIAVWI